MVYYHGFFKTRLMISILLFTLLTIPWLPERDPSAQVVLHVPRDYPTIQAAVDAAPEGAIILINFRPPKGIYYEEAITISKSVTLRAESITAFIRGPNPLTVPKPVEGVINIVSNVPIQVTLEDLNISQGELHNVIWVKGPARVVFNKVYIAYYYGYSGLVAESSAQLTLRDSIISGFWGEGLRVTNAIVELINSQISSTGENTGLIIGGSSRVSLQNSIISGHSGGIVIVGPAQLILQDSLVVGNRVAVEAHNNPVSDQPALVVVESSQVSSNRHTGLYIESSIVQLRDSFVIGNGVDPKCHQLPLACGSGIILHSKAQLKLRSTEIRNNATWGVAAYLPQCGAPSYVPPFPFEVIFEDNKSVIESNNRSGVLNGMGNPGNHPFKNLPDGQVCLP